MEMTTEEFERRLRELGLEKTGFRRGAAREWRHADSEYSPWICDGNVLTPEAKESTIERVKYNLGLGPMPTSHQKHDVSRFVVKPKQP
jgi:hypothetical protein